MPLAAAGCRGWPDCWSLPVPLPPVREYLPKNGWAENGTFGLGKSPQNLPLADFMYAPQIGAAIAPPCALGPKG